MPRGCRWHPACCGWRQDSYLSPQALLTCRVTPAKRQAPRLSCLQEACPLQASSLLSHLGPAVRMESEQRHFGNTDAHRSYGSAKTTRATAALWRPVKSSMMTAVGRAGPKPRGTLHISSACSSGSSTLFPSEARQTPDGVQRWCNSWRVHSVSSPCHSLPSEQHCAY